MLKIGLLLLGEIGSGRIIKGGAFCSQALAFDHDIVALGIRDEGQRIDTLCLEIHRMYVVAPCTINEARDLGPYGGHRTHAAGLQGRIEGSPM